jgi:PAS domain S-box-containing protein
MLYQLFGSLHVRLGLFVIVVMTPALALVLYTGMEQRRHAAQIVQEDALRTTYTVTSYQEQLILSTHQLLKLLADTPAVTAHDSSSCSEVFARFNEQYPFYSLFAAADQDGTIFCGSSANVVEDMSSNVADRDWFKRSVDIRRFVVSDVIVRSSGNAVQTFGYPVYDQNKQLRAVIVAGLDINHLNEFSTRAQLPEGSIITMFDHHGTILARYPQTDEWVGQSLPDHPMIRTILDHQGEGTAELPGLDGTSQLFAFTYLRFNQQGLYLSIGVPSEVAFRDANRLLARNLGMFVLIVLVEIVVAGIGGNIFIMRPIRLLANATQRLAEGDLTTSIDTKRNMGDLTILATSFNNMIDKLRQHETSLRQAEVRYRSLVEHVPAVIYTLDLTTDCMTYISPRIQTLLGHPVDVWLNDRKKWISKIHPDDQPHLIQAIARSRETGGDLSIEYRLLHQDGSNIWVRDDGVVVKNEMNNGYTIRGTLLDISERKEAEDIIQYQAETMRELSTPLLHIGEQIMLMPVIGALDSIRAQQMMEALLKGVERQGARVVILDITGVSVVDTQVARAFIDVEHAIRLLGARMILTGVRPEVAQAIVGLGIDLQSIMTHSTLQSGISSTLWKRDTHYQFSSTSPL